MLKKYAHQIEVVLDIFVLPLTLLIANRATWLCVFEINRPLFSCEYGTRTDEFILYVFALIMALWLIYHRKQQKLYWTIWKQNWILILFVGFSFLSAIWTLDVVLTFYVSLLILVSGMVAAYLGMRYSSEQWLRIISFFGVVVIILSYLLVAVLPGAAIMSNLGMVGSWRGVFSHKNYMGAIIAYSSAAILYALFTLTGTRLRILFAVSFLLSLGLMVMSQSATGMILFILLNGLTLVWLAFRQWGRLLRRIHYILLGIGALGVALVTALNLNAVFGIIGRNSALTGRVPLWLYLIDKLKAGHLWLGYGMGTIWNDAYFRIKAEYDLGWSFQVINGHNGFVDVLLYLGIVGLALFLAVVILTVYRSLKYRPKDNRLAFWPVVTVVYVVIVNLTISFFFQFETFHWVLLIVVLFMTTPIQSRMESHISE